MSADPDRARLAAALWLLLAFLVWHDRFDHEIRTAARRYLAAQHQYVLGRAPFVPINATMGPAASSAALDATAWSALVAVIGLAAVTGAARRPTRGSQSPGPGIPGSGLQAPGSGQ
jgi:hypothetical protein